MIQVLRNLGPQRTCFNIIKLTVSSKAREDTGMQTERKRSRHPYAYRVHKRPWRKLLQQSTSREIVFLPKAIGRFRSVRQTANAIFHRNWKDNLNLNLVSFLIRNGIFCTSEFSVLCLLYYFLCLRGFILVVNSKHFKAVFGLFITFY